MIVDLVSMTRWSVPLFFLPYLDSAGTTGWPNASDDQSAKEVISVYRTKATMFNGPGVTLEVLFLLGMSLFWHIFAFCALRLNLRPARHYQQMLGDYLQRLYEDVLPKWCDAARERLALAREHIERVIRRVDDYLRDQN